MQKISKDVWLHSSQNNVFLEVGRRGHASINSTPYVHANYRFREYYVGAEFVVW